MSRKKYFIRQLKRNYNKNSQKPKKEKVNKPKVETKFQLVLKKQLNPKSENQTEYITSIAENDITFCIGPSGSGKTHISVGLALEYLAEEKISRIVLTRPAVEAGESLGFLPGQMQEKLAPYLAPLMNEMNYYASYSDITYMIAHKIIDVVPLAFMRGVTFRNSLIILDEAQNATLPQLKLFLTRIGYGSKMIINGDVNQSDLSYGESGLKYCVERLSGVKNIGTVKLEAKDIVRHPIIGEILKNLDGPE